MHLPSVYFGGIMKFTGISLIITIVFLLAGCEAIFTTTPIGDLQRDFSTMTDEQIMDYADKAIAAGDTAAMNAVLSEIRDMIADAPADEQLNLLAAELALSASGISQAMLGMFTSDTSGLTQSDFESIIGGIDMSLIGEVDTYMSKLDLTDETISATLIVVGTVSIGLELADDAGGFSNIDLLNTDTQNTILTMSDYFDAAENKADLDGGIQSFIDAFESLFQP